MFRSPPPPPAKGHGFVEVKYFVDCVDGNRNPDRVTPEEAKQAVALCVAARTSAEKGKPVTV